MRGLNRQITNSSILPLLTLEQKTAQDPTKQKHLFYLILLMVFKWNFSTNKKCQQKKFNKQKCQQQLEVVFFKQNNRSVQGTGFHHMSEDESMTLCNWALQFCWKKDGAISLIFRSFYNFIIWYILWYSNNIWCKVSYLDLLSLVLTGRVPIYRRLQDVNSVSSAFFSPDFVKPFLWLGMPPAQVRPLGHQCSDQHWSGLCELWVAWILQDLPGFPAQAFPSEEIAFAPWEQPKKRYETELFWGQGPIQRDQRS